jgi:hypothetical protein
LRVSTRKSNEGGKLQPAKGLDDGTLIVNDKVRERKEKFSVAPQPNTVMTTVSDRGHPQTPYSILETAVTFLRLPSRALINSLSSSVCRPGQRCLWRSISKELRNASSGLLLGHLSKTLITTDNTIKLS